MNDPKDIHIWLKKVLGGVCVCVCVCVCMLQWGINFKPMKEWFETEL